MVDLLSAWAAHPQQKPANCLARYVVTKHSWRGKYRRIMCITPDAVVTQNPESGMAITNTYAFTGDSDIDSINVGPGNEADGEFIISARQDKKSKFKPLKFTCSHRSQLLTDLFHSIATAHLRGRCGVAPRLIGSPDHFPGYEWSGCEWRRTTLRVTASGLELVDREGSPTWRIDYCVLASVALAPLAMETLPSYTSPDGTAGPTGLAGGALANGLAPTPEFPFALFSRCSRAPHLLACPQREMVLSHLAAIASKRLGIRLVVDHTSGACPSSLLEAVARSERQAFGAAGEAPVAEWEVARLCPRYDAQPPLAALLEPGMSARCRPPASLDPAQVAATAAAMSYSPGACTVPRRLAVTRTRLVERDATTYEVEERRPLASVSAVLRFAEEAGLVGVEWADGAAPSLYSAGAARDAVVAAVLDLAQTLTGRPIPVLPGFTPPGDPIVGDSAGPLATHSTLIARDPETERWCLDLLAARAREAWPHFSNSGRMFYTADIEFTTSPTPSTLATLMSQPLSPRSHQGAAAGGAGGTKHAGAAQTDGAGAPAPGAAGAGQHPPQQQHPPTGVVMSGTAVPLGHSASAADNARAATAVQEAADAMLDAVHDFNASVPYDGVGPGTRLDEQALSCVLALLHPDLVPGPVGVSHLPADEAKQSIAALQALHRLLSCHALAEAFLGLPTALGRVMAAYSCGHEGVAAEAARLLVRLWAPAAARVGAAPWSGLRAAPTLASLMADPDDPLSGCDPEDLSLARSAKALCFGPSIVTARCSTLMAPLRGGGAAAAAASAVAGATSSGSGGGARSAAATGGRPPPVKVPSSIAVAAAANVTTSSAYLVACALEAVGAVAVEPGSRSTDNRPLSGLLQEAATLGPPLFALCHHPAPRVTQGAALLMRAVAESGAAAAAPMRQAALRYGAMLHHLHAALFAGTTGGRSGGGGDGGGGAEGRQQLGRALVASWCDEYAPALALLRRVFPPGLVRYLNAPRANTSVAAAASAPASMPPAPPQPPPAAPATAAAAPSHPGAPQPQPANPGEAPLMASAHPGTGPLGTPGAGLPAGSDRSGGAVAVPPQADAVAAAAGAPAAAPGGPAAPAPTSAAAAAGAATTSWGLKGNWEAFWDAACRDHCHAGLIWHAGCRQELREALEREEAGLRARRQQLGGGGGGGLRLGWNYEEFYVTYPSLASYTVVGGIYVRLLLEGADPAAVEKVPNPRDLFNSLHHTFLCAADPATQDPATAAAAAVATRNGAGGGATTSSTGNGPAAGAMAPVATASAAAAAEAAAAADQELCARAMAAVYHVHAGAVGPVDGVLHLLRVLDNTPRRPLRHALLELVASLLAPKCLPEPAAAGGPAARAVRANSYAFMDAAGLELLTDVVSYAHTGGSVVEGGSGLVGTAGAPPLGWGASSRDAHGAAAAAAPKEGLMITSMSHDGMPREWYFYPRGLLLPSAVPAAAAAAAAAGGGGSGGGSGDAAADGRKDEVASAVTAAGAVPGAPDLLGRRPDETGRAGPYTRDEVRQLVSRGSVDWGTLCWAAGMLRPEPLGSVRELRWMLARGPGRLSAYAAAELALSLLHRLVALQPAEDSEEGLVLQPLPRAYRDLTGPRCLPHLCQAILTFHPPIVTSVCLLLDSLLAPHPDALARLHLTGALYFALAYPGSDLSAPAQLLHRAHLAQDFAGLAGGAAAAAGLPLRQRSYLGHVLPESLLYVLETNGAEAFAEALCGDHDTPELIWTHAMRRGRLLPALYSHLGDLPLRLAQRAATLWDYSPLPPLGYPELEGELYCHRYYLRHLADTTRFPNWPLVDHLPLLQSLLAEWRAELGRQPLSLSEADTCEVLGLKRPTGPSGEVAAIGEEELRRAYRALARKYHPDKNPQGRPMFLKIQAAYERLQAGVAGGQGPQPWRILLLLRAQCVLYGRYGKELAPYKYAGYGLLLDTIRGGTARGGTAAAPAAPGKTGTGMGTGSGTEAGTKAAEAPAPGSFFSGEALEQVTAASQLCWLTVLSCRRNAEELARCGGVDVLSELLSRAVGVLPLDAAPTDPAAIVATAALRTLAGLAAVPEARAALIHPAGVPGAVSTGVGASAPPPPEAPVKSTPAAAAAGLCRDLLRCCGLSRCHSAADAALVAVGHLAAAPELQAALLRAGALQALVPLLLKYDNTLPEAVRATLSPPFSGPDDSATLPLLALPESAPARTSTPAARALHAVLAAQALSRLAGMLAPPHATPACSPARAALSALLTEPLAARLADPDPRPLLELLNGTHETCRVIWNASMREELMAFLDDSKQSHHPQHHRGHDHPGTTHAAHANDATAGGADKTAAAAGDGGDLLSALSSFSHRSLAGELVVGGVFVRVFNARPAELPPDPPAFCKALVRYLFDALLPLPPPHLPPAASLPPLLAVLTATGCLLDAEPRLLGVLASRSAMSPFVAALQPAALAASGLQALLQPQQHQQQDRRGTQAVAASAHGSGGGGKQQGAGEGPAEEEQAGESWRQRWEWSDQMAQGGLALLARAAQHGGCSEAFADEHCSRLLFWLLHGPTSLATLTAALKLLKAVIGQSTGAAVAAQQGGWLYLLEVLLHRGPWTWQQAAAAHRRRGHVAGEGRSAGSAGAGDTGGTSEEPGLEGDGPAEDEARCEAAALLGRLLAHGSHGSMVRLSLQRLLPPGLVATIAEGPPPAVLQALEQRVETPECIWDTDMSSNAATQVAVLSSELRARQAEGQYDWALPPGSAVQYDKLRGELFVGGAYVRLFLKNPKHPLRNPSKFAEGIMDRYLPELASASRDTDLLVLLAAAMVALLRSHSLLSDHLCRGGYPIKLLVQLGVLTRPLQPSAPQPALPVAADASGGGGLMSPRQSHTDAAAAVSPLTPPPPSQSAAEAAAAAASLGTGVAEAAGSALRILHQLCDSPTAAEALSTATAPPAVQVLYGAMRLGPAARVLVLETLKRALAVANRQRDALVLQALQYGLIPELLTSLDWAAASAGAAGASGAGAGGGSGDSAVLRVLAVDVLRALQLDGIHAFLVRQQLDASPIWQAYCHQRHDMFLPSGASAQGSVVGLLTAPETARFALPPPEAMGH